MEKKYCVFYIVRHGQTEWNVKRRIQGQINIELNENGIEQAKKTAEKLKKIKFHEAFSSDLSRAKRTAEIIALEKKLAVTTTELLREKSYGKFEGKSYEAFQKELRKYLDEFEALTDDAKWKYEFPTVESDDQVITRFLRFIREIAVAYPGKNILVATHAAVIGNLLIHLGVWEYKDQHKRKIENAGYLVVRSDGIDLFVDDADGIDIATKK